DTESDISPAPPSACPSRRSPAARCPRSRSCGTRLRTCPGCPAAGSPASSAWRQKSGRCSRFSASALAPPAAHVRQSRFPRGRAPWSGKTPVVRFPAPASSSRDSRCASPCSRVCVTSWRNLAYCASDNALYARRRTLPSDRREVKARGVAQDMVRQRAAWVHGGVAVATAAVIGFLLLRGEASTEGRQHTPRYVTWSDYGGSADSMQYSALTQINRNTVSTLQQAWFYPVSGEPSRLVFNPLVVDDVMYVRGANNRLVALDATNGREIWRSTEQASERGVSYWESADRSDRRLMVTA